MLPVGAASLFHFKADQTQYDIKPEDLNKKPLIFLKGGSHRQLLLQRLLHLCVLQVQRLAEHEVHGSVVLRVRHCSHSEHLSTA
jgi:hypothetical protein